jgi:hypothetical protein
VVRSFVILPELAERLTWSAVGMALCDLGIAVIEPELEADDLSSDWRVRVSAIAGQVRGLDDAAFVGMGMNGLWLPWVVAKAGGKDASMVFVDALIPPEVGDRSDFPALDARTLEEVRSVLLPDGPAEPAGGAADRHGGFESKDALRASRDELSGWSADFHQALLHDGEGGEAAGNALEIFSKIPPSVLEYALGQMEIAEDVTPIDKWPTQSIAYVALTESGQFQGQAAKSKGWAFYNATGLHLDLAKNPRSFANLLVEADSLARSKHRRPSASST